MDVSYENVIAAWLVADGQTLIAPQYPLRIGEPTMAEPVRWPDILAVQPKNRRAFLCEVTWSKDWSRHGKKIAEYRDHIDNIRASLEHWLGIEGEAWQISVWYFVPAAHVEKIRSMETGVDFPLKVTSLESIKPWSYTWGYRKADAQEDGTNGERSVL